MDAVVLGDSFGEDEDFVFFDTDVDFVVVCGDVLIEYFEYLY